MATTTRKNTRKTAAKAKPKTKEELVEKMKAMALEPEEKVEAPAKVTKANETTGSKKETKVETKEAKDVDPTEETNTKEKEEVSVEEEETQEVVGVESDETIDENDLPFIDEIKNDGTIDVSCSDDTEKPKKPTTYENMFGYKWMGWGYSE